MKRMPTIWRIGLATFVGLVACPAIVSQLFASQPRHESGHKLLQVSTTNTDELMQLMALDRDSTALEIWNDHPEVGVIDVLASSSGALVLIDRGFTFKVVVSDIKAKYEDLFSASEGEGFFDSYQDYDAHVAFMQDLVLSHPSLAQMINIGTSVQGRTLWVIRITGTGSNKAGVLYHGAQHGNEIMGAAVITYLSQYLLTSYGSDPLVTNLVDNVDFFLMPVMNPDGYEIGWRGNANSYDLNRDWGGPATVGGFTQPETAALRDLLASHPHIQTHVDLHSYGNDVLWPWGHTEYWCAEHLTFAQLGTSMADAIFGIRGRKYLDRGPIFSTLYEIVGGSIDYSYDERSAWSFVIEIGNGFYEPEFQILPTCQELTAALVFLASWSYDCNGNGIHDVVDALDSTFADCNGNKKPDECEPPEDFDHDGTINICDSDADDDSLPNEIDVCPYNRAGVPVDVLGRPLGDIYNRCQVTLYEFVDVIQCYYFGGPEVQHPGGDCFDLDFDQDNDFDLRDWSVFERAFGPPS